MIENQGRLFPDYPFTFGPKFLQDHAGQIITDPRIALVELVANSYDAGASIVRLTWPDTSGETFEVEDNGTGMSYSEFNRRWKTLSYSRPKEQGIYVEYPPGVRGSKRLAFGQNGKGRYGTFCFTDTYEVGTWKDENSTFARVQITHGGRNRFIVILSEVNRRLVMGLALVL